MPVTQTIRFDAVSLVDIGSGTITAQLLDGAASPMLAGITETAVKGRYTGTLTDHAAGTFELRIFWNGKLVGSYDAVALLLAAGTYIAADATGGGGGGSLTTEQANQLTAIFDALYPADPDSDPVVVLPSEGLYTTCYLTIRSQAGPAAAGVSVWYRTANQPAGEYGIGYVSELLSVTSSDVGLIQIPNVAKGSSITLYPGSETAQPITVDIPSTAGTTYALPSLVIR